MKTKYLFGALMAVMATSCTAKTNDPAAPQSGKTVVVYFSKTVPDGVDATTGATPVVNYNGQQMGATQYVATLVAEQTGADIQRITVADDHYPVQYNALADVAKAERDNNEHPALTSTHDLSGYDNIILGMPVWWYTMPMPVYSFLDMVDLSGKNVYAFTTHEGSGLNGTPGRVQDVEPDALVSSDGWASRGGQVQQNASTLTGWLQRLGLYKEQTSAVENITEQTPANAPSYNLLGQRVSNATKGVVIRNGQKTLNR